MALIAGLRCRDGLLLASDREESGGDRKDSVKKIQEFQNSRCVLAIAGAGHGPLCDYAVEQMRLAANEAKEKFVGNHIEVLSKALLAVHTDYIWESRSGEDRRIAFIVGIYDLTKDEQSLYLTHEEILQPKSDYACIGIGEIIGAYFLERLYEFSLSVFEANTLLAFILK